MITVTLTPQTGAHVDIVAQAMKALLDSLSPPAVAPTQADMAKAVTHAIEIKQAKEAAPPKPVKAAKEEAPTVAAPATPTSGGNATASTTPTETTQKADPTPSATTAGIEYATVQKAITDMVKTDRDRAVAALSKFGVKKGTELKVEQYADFLAELA